jgi:DNA-binding NarL/FixJ family response regulator
MNRILIVDDHVLFREGMRNIIHHWEGYEVVGEAANGLEALNLSRELLPDIILMDIAMPVMDGIHATKRIASELPSIRIIMLTTSEEEEDLLSAIKYGAQGYILKDTPSKRLHDELRRMTQGETPLSGLMATKVLKEFGRSSNSTQAPCEYQESLTERELQILELLVEGLSNAGIAERIYLSQNTVKKHVSNILEKLHSNNRVEAAVHAVRGRLVD